MHVGLTTGALQFDRSAIYFSFLSIGEEENAEVGQLSCPETQMLFQSNLQPNTQVLKPSTPNPLPSHITFNFGVIKQGARVAAERGRKVRRCQNDSGYGSERLSFSVGFREGDWHPLERLKVNRFKPYPIAPTSLRKQGMRSNQEHGKA